MGGKLAILRFVKAASVSALMVLKGVPVNVVPCLFKVLLMRVSQEVILARALPHLVLFLLLNHLRLPHLSMISGRPVRFPPIQMLFMFIHHSPVLAELLFHLPYILLCGSPVHGSARHDIVRVEKGCLLIGRCLLFAFDRWKLKLV